MKFLIYSWLLGKYGVTYLGTVLRDSFGIIIYGYNKELCEYSFWNISKECGFTFITKCDTRTEAEFTYKILLGRF